MTVDKRNVRGRLLVAAALTVCLLLCAGGCWMVGGSNLLPLGTSDLVGTWEGPSGRKLVLDKSGRFTAVKIYCFDGEIDGDGKWTIESEVGTKQVDLFFVDAKCGSYMDIQRTRDLRIRLFKWIDDPDSGQRMYFDRV